MSLVRLAVVRHGRAGNAPTDDERRLTPGGREGVVRTAAALRARGFSGATILSSPLARAVETAGMVAEALGSPLPLADDRLAPGADPSTLMKAAAETGAGCVVLVGHMPDVGVLAGSVARSPSLHLSPAAAVVFSTGGRGELEMEAVIDPEEA